MSNQNKKYISVKLPACGNEYPLDANGCRKLPDYTPEYLEKHGRKLFKILLERVPSKVYSELLKCMRDHEKN
jgi:hypothetical protein